MYTNISVHSFNIIFLVIYFLCYNLWCKCRSHGSHEGKDGHTWREKNKIHIRDVPDHSYRGFRIRVYQPRESCCVIVSVIAGCGWAARAPTSLRQGQLAHDPLTWCIRASRELFTRTRGSPPHCSWWLARWISSHSSLQFPSFVNKRELLPVIHRFRGDRCESKHVPALIYGVTDCPCVYIRIVWTKVIAARRFLILLYRRSDSSRLLLKGCTVFVAARACREPSVALLMPAINHTTPPPLTTFFMGFYVISGTYGLCNTSRWASLILAVI